MRGDNLTKHRLSKEARLKVLGVEGLEAGEVSVLVRLRIPKGLLAQVRGLSAKERGRVLAAGMQALATGVTGSGNPPSRGE